MSKLRQRVIEELTLRNYSPRTVERYVGHLRRFAKHFGRSPANLGPEEIRTYQLYLVNEKQVSWASFNQAVCAIRFLHVKVLKSDVSVKHLPYAKKPKALPKVVHQHELRKLFAAIENAKHLAMALTLYGTGLRLLELCNLEVSDLDGQRKLVHVRMGKGQRDRLVPFPEWLRSHLRGYYRRYRPSTLMFYGVYKAKVIHTTVLQRALKKASAGLRVPVTPHMLRHCYTTHLLETGTDVHTLMVYLGHKKLRTTMVYNHVRRGDTSATVSPLHFSL